MEVINEQSTTQIKPNSVADKYSVFIKKSNIIVGHLPLGKNGWSKKEMFYFFCAESYAECNVNIDHWQRS